jgi:metal-responsive CopG/Arc/MetJ family transcriptional regulator
MGIKITSVSLPEDVWKALKKVENRSQYITNLIRQDLNKTPKALTKQDVLNIVQQYLESNQIEPPHLKYLRRFFVITEESQIAPGQPTRYI